MTFVSQTFWEVASPLFRVTYWGDATPAFLRNRPFLPHPLLCVHFPTSSWKSLGFVGLSVLPLTVPGSSDSLLKSSFLQWVQGGAGIQCRTARQKAIALVGFLSEEFGGLKEPPFPPSPVRTGKMWPGLAGELGD